MKILGIETSCDETGVAIFDTAQGLLADLLYSQVALHSPYGGVVPELASRDHVRTLLPLVRQCLSQANCALTELDGIAYTAGPGLIGGLMVGASFARTLAWALNKPAIGVHHMEAHLLVTRLSNPDLTFPFVALLVSGGHTQLVEARAFGEYVLLGETLDDAVGEAFDKTAKLLGLGYPGGPAISALAEKGLANVYRFPRPMVDRSGLAMSFSGLKTHTRYTWESSNQRDQTKADIARAFQTAVVETLAIKCKRALQATGHTRLVVAGGVSANRALRQRLQALSATVYFPELAYCSDNGAMVAYTGACHQQQGKQDSDLAITVRARWPWTVPLQARKLSTKDG